jgi:hypothetical protein
MISNLSRNPYVCSNSYIQLHMLAFKQPNVREQWWPMDDVAAWKVSFHVYEITVYRWTFGDSKKSSLQCATVCVVLYTGFPPK